MTQLTGHLGKQGRDLTATHRKPSEHGVLRNIHCPYGGQLGKSVRVIPCMETPYA